MKTLHRATAVRALEIVCLAALVLFLVQAYHRAYRPFGYDLTPRLAAATALLGGRDPYGLLTPFPLTYPLFICVLFVPLARLPYWAANLAWFLVSVASLAASVAVIFRLVAPGGSWRRARELFVLCFLPLSNVIQSNLVNGQVNFFVLALCTLGLRALLRRKAWMAGLLIAAAISIKLTPAILVVYLLLRRDWAATGWTCLGVLLFTVLLPYAVAGPSIVDFYHGYLRNYVLPTLASGGTTNLATTFALSSYVHALVPSLHGVALGAIAAALALVPLAVLQLRAAGAGESASREALLFCGYLAASLWILPISETHHLAALIPALVILTWYSLRARGDGLVRRLVPVLLMDGLILLGVVSFVFYFAAIAICYGLLCHLLATPQPAGEMQPAT